MKTFKLLLYTTLIGIVAGFGFKTLKPDKISKDKKIIVVESNNDVSELIKIEPILFDFTNNDIIKFKDSLKEISNYYEDDNIIQKKRKNPQNTLDLKETEQFAAGEFPIKEAMRRCECSHTDESKEPCITVHLKPVYVVDKMPETIRKLRYFVAENFKVQSINSPNQSLKLV